MSTTEKLTGVRWSSAVNCTRQCAYKAAGAPEAPITEEQEGWMIRGTVIGDWYVKAHLPEEQHELTVPWPADDPVGEGHADSFNPETGHLTEVKTNQGHQLYDSAVLQAFGYAKNLGAKTAEVVVVDPSTFMVQRFPINLESDELAQQVADIEAEVTAAVRDGVMPDRACKHPGDAPGRMCPFVEHCFDGWERPEVGELYGGDELFRELHDLREALKGLARGARPDLEERRDEIQQELLAYLEPGEEYVMGGIQVKRTTVKGRLTFKTADYLKAGHELDPETNKYVKEGAPSDRWYVKEVQS